MPRAAITRVTGAGYPELLTSVNDWDTLFSITAANIVHAVTYGTVLYATFSSGAKFQTSTDNGSTWSTYADPAVTGTWSTRHTLAAQHLWRTPTGALLASMGTGTQIVRVPPLGGSGTEVTVIAAGTSAHRFADRPGAIGVLAVNGAAAHRFATSVDDGQTWADQALPADAVTPYSVFATPSAWLLAAEDSSSQVRIFRTTTLQPTSSDWTQVLGPVPGGGGYRVPWFGQLGYRIVAKVSGEDVLSSASAGYSYSDNDGVTWAQGLATTQHIHSLTSTHNAYISLRENSDGNNLYLFTSTDGTTWTNEGHLTLGTATAQQMGQVTLAQGEDGRRGPYSDPDCPAVDEGEPPPVSCECTVGTLVKSTSGGGATQSVSGLQGTPSVVIFWSEGATTLNTWRTGHQTSFGMATSTEQYCQAVAVEDAAATSNGSRNISNNRAIRFIDPNGTVLADATCAISGTSFTLTWGTNDSNAFLIHYKILFGVSVDIVPFTTPAASGSQSITGAAFQPQAVLFFHGGAQTAFNTSTGTNATLGIGACDSSLNQWYCTTASSEPVATTITDTAFATGFAIIVIAGDGANFGQANVTSLDAAGFTLNWSFNTVGWHMVALCLRACNLAVGFVVPTTTVHDVALAFTPSGSFLVSNSSLVITNQIHAVMDIGATDGSNHATSHRQDQDAVSDSVVDAISRTDVTLALGDDFTPATEVTVVASHPADTLRLTASSTQYRVGYLAIG